jgi:hypothetical protein
MRVNILCKEAVIGHADLEPIDPPMGIAGGCFIPSSEYESRLHAYLIDGDDNDLEDRTELSARSDQYGMLECQGVVIEDYNETFGEINVTVLGMAYPEYETIFGSREFFKAYWHKDA